MYLYTHDRFCFYSRIPVTVTKIVKYKILEGVKLITEYGYKNKTYRVYKDTYAYRFMKRNHLQFTLIEEK